MECNHEYGDQQVPKILHLVPAMEPWYVVFAVDDPRAENGVRIFTRRIVCWALTQEPGAVVVLEGITAQEDEVGETAAERLYPEGNRAVLGYAPADEVQDLPRDRTDWRELARHWPAMRRAAEAPRSHNGAEARVPV